MPRNEEECMQNAVGFSALAGFLRCICAIDCTHIKISSPGDDIVSFSFVLLWLQQNSLIFQNSFVRQQFDMIFFRNS